MLKKILVLIAMLYAAVCFAAVDVNKASAAELDSIKGIGPAVSTKILDERKKGNFKDWNDFIERVKGVGEGNAAKFSTEGLTVGGAAYKGSAAAPVGKKDEKASAKVDAKPVAAVAPAAASSAAKEEKKDPKAEEKQKKADEAKAKKEGAKKAKDDKTEAAKSAASAAKK
jgi:competence protein ComEA